jgi:hypothetical protein
MPFRELLYVDGEERLVSVPVAAGPTFAPDRATPPFGLADGVGRGQGWRARTAGAGLEPAATTRRADSAGDGYNACRNIDEASDRVRPDWHG